MAVNIERLPVARDVVTLRLLAAGRVRAVSAAAINSLGLVLVMLALIASLTALSLTGHAIPDSLSFALTATIGAQVGQAVGEARAARRTTREAGGRGQS